METTLLYSTICYIICYHFLNNLEDMIWCDMQNELLKWVLRKYNTRKTLKRYVYFVTIWLKSFLLCWNSYSQMFFYVNETREKFTTRLSAKRLLFFGCWFVHRGTSIFSHIAQRIIYRIWILVRPIRPIQCNTNHHDVKCHKNYCQPQF